MRQLVERWLTLTSIAVSILCAIECTILPPLLAVAPLLGFASGQTSGMLHERVDQAILFILLPIAVLAVVLNYLRHGNKRVALLGMLGACIVYASHSDLGRSGHAEHDPTKSVDWQFVLLSLLHLAFSWSGSACLLYSNYLSHSIAPHSCCSNHHEHNDRHSIRRCRGFHHHDGATSSDERCHHQKNEKTGWSYHRIHICRKDRSDAADAPSSDDDHDHHNMIPESSTERCCSNAMQKGEVNRAHAISYDACGHLHEELDFTSRIQGRVCEMSAHLQLGGLDRREALDTDTGSTTSSPDAGSALLNPAMDGNSRSQQRSIQGPPVFWRSSDSDV